MTDISEQLKQFEAQLPLPELVEAVNQLYHGLEANNYDARHPEIHRQLPAIWKEMVGVAIGEKPQDEGWHILNFGCGTGFEAEQVVRSLPKGTIKSITCYDASAEMLKQCRAKLAPIHSGTKFTSDLAEAFLSEGPYTLLLTNSVLHHLPDPTSSINDLRPLLTRDAIWIAGHEPSSRFYRNSSCMENYAAFLRERRWRKVLSLKGIFLRFRQMAGSGSVAAATAREAQRAGLFKRQPSAFLISRLVDFRVAHSAEEAASGRGFDFERMERDFEGLWALTWVRTYSFMGSFYEATLPRKWRTACSDLRRRFPADGANFSAVWKRI